MSLGRRLQIRQATLVLKSRSSAAASSILQPAVYCMCDEVDKMMRIRRGSRITSSVYDNVASMVRLQIISLQFLFRD